MNVVGKVSSFITQGVYSVATPFHPFGGAVDIIVVQQQDGTFRSTPWYVRFGKFQGVLKGAEKIVRIEVNGVEANFNMYLDNSGEAYFVREFHPEKDKDDGEFYKDPEDLEGGQEDSNGNIDSSKETDFLVEESGEFNSDEVEVRDERVTLGMDRLERVESDVGRVYYDLEDTVDEFSEYGAAGYDNLDNIEEVLESEEKSNSEVVLVSIDGNILTAPISSSERIDDAEDMQLSSPCLDLGPGEGTEELNHLGEVNTETLLQGQQELESKGSNNQDTNVCMEGSFGNTDSGIKNREVFKSCLELTALSGQPTNNEPENTGLSSDDPNKESSDKPEEGNLEISRNDDELPRQDSENPGSVDQDCSDGAHVNDQELQEQVEGDPTVKRMPSGEESLASDVCSNSGQVGPHTSASSGDMKLDTSTTFGPDLPINPDHAIPVEGETPSEAKGDDPSVASSTEARRWRLWPIPFGRVKTIKSSNEEVCFDPDSVPQGQRVVPTVTPRVAIDSPRKQIVRTNVPTTDEIASLNLQEGQNVVNFVFSTRVLGPQKVEAHIYLWKWNTRIVISDVDGTITKSDVLGQVMPLVGKDWTHSGIARLFCAIKENGYQLLFLSARAIVQSYITKNFLFNLKQDGKSLPTGPVVISPDGLFPSLYREVIRRAPHEFKIACLEDIKALFPPDYNPFYAGFGNRDTDELSYRKIGIPKGKIFIINPKGEVAINHRIDAKSYTSLHTLVNDMFPPTSMVEQEDYNSWNYWKMPLPEMDNL